MLFAAGSRGDIQPSAALGSALHTAGFVVRIMTNVNHVEFLRGFGLDSIGATYDMEKAMKDNMRMRDCMANGDFQAWMKGMEEINMARFPTDLSKMIEEVDTWKPDLIISAPFMMHEADAIAGARRIPVIHATLQCLLPSRDQQSMIGEPGWFPHLPCGTFILHAIWSGEHRVKTAALLKQLPESKTFTSLSFRQFMLQYNHPFTPTIVGYSPTMYAAKGDWPAEAREQTHFTGFWVVPEEEQQAKLQQEDPAFGGDDAVAIRGFLADGPAVYLGWGSMVAVSGVHMACLAVRSLMKAKLRGIVLGGWAKLNPSMLEGHQDSSDMKSYANSNVLFVKSAPHEWLFPQCQATVHHGGSGTTAAALRSGVPTVITPCAFDQFDNANLAASTGAGIALRQFSKVTVSDLAAALKRCVSDEEMVHTAKAFGQSLRAESGLSNAVSVVDNFFVDEVDSGRWLEKFERRAAEMRHLQRQRAPHWLAWFARLVCSPSPNDYSVRIG